MPKLALSPVNEPNSPILIVSWENAEPATARMTPKTRRNRRFIISAGLLAIGAKTARPLNGQRLAFGGAGTLCSFNTGQTETILLPRISHELLHLLSRTAHDGER